MDKSYTDITKRISGDLRKLRQDIPDTMKAFSALAQAATRDYVLSVDAPSGDAALLSIFGGKITTYRRLAEAALEKLSPYLPPTSGRTAGWTGAEPLPGGNFAIDGFDDPVHGKHQIALRPCLVDQDHAVAEGVDEAADQ